MLTVTFMKAIGRTIRLTEEESTLMLMAAVMRANGAKISSMVMALRDGLMVLHMKASTKKAKSTEKVNLPGLTTALTLETSLTITSMAQVFMNGQTAESFLENGAITRWRAMAHSPGLMVEDMLATILMT